MSTAATPPPATPVVPVTGNETITRFSREVRIISHSSLFYWWPVWALGFLMSLINAFGSQRLAVVPEGTVPQTNQRVEGYAEPRDILITPKDAHLLKDPSTGQVVTPYLHISSSKNMGVLFCTVLLIVIFITNVPLRGLWSVIAIGFIILMSIIFALLEWWDKILTTLSFLDIRINMGGYLFISSVLFVLWLIVFFFFDRQIYMVFTPGQLRVRLEIGDAETAYDTRGMTVQKERTDLFRHWVLGLGSGDLLIHTSGANAKHFHMANVLFLGRKVKEIEELMATQLMATQISPP